MKWRRYKLLIIGGGVCLILLVISIVFLVRFSGANRSTGKKLESAVTRLRALRTNDPFPSGANVKQLKQNLEAVQEFSGGFHKELAAGQIEPIPMEPTGFNRYFGQTRNALLAHAAPPSAEDKESDTPDSKPEEQATGVILPSEFDFGFTKYAQGTPPRQEDIERLTIQLQTVSRLCKDLFDLGITELSEVTRQEFESSDSASEFISGIDSGIEAFGWMGAEAEAEEEEEESRLYSSEHYRFTITCSEEIAWQVLSKLSDYDLFLVLTAVGIQNTNPSSKLQPQVQGTPTGIRPGRTRRSTRPTRSTRRSARIVPPPGSSVPGSGMPGLGMVQREVLAGREQVKLVLDFDVYRFKLDYASTKEEGN